MNNICETGDGVGLRNVGLLQPCDVAVKLKCFIESYKVLWYIVSTHTIHLVIYWNYLIFLRIQYMLLWNKSFFFTSQISILCSLIALHSGMNEWLKNQKIVCKNVAVLLLNWRTTQCRYMGDEEAAPSILNFKYFHCPLDRRLDGLPEPFRHYYKERFLPVGNQILIIMCYTI